MSTESEFKFLGYRVTKIALDIKNEFFVQHESKFNTAIDIQQNFVEQNNRFVEVVLNIKVTDEQGNFDFILLVRGGFEASKEMPDELFRALATVNAPAILYPFARAIVTTYTAQANIPPIFLPAVNFMPAPPEATKKESRPAKKE